jgi:uncharacterized protein (TIGR02646 family)
VQRTDCPPELDGPTSRGGKERAAAIAFFSDPTNLRNKFNYTAYKSKGVRDSLRLMFQGKCAYCESRFAGTAAPEHEHFRPKREVQTPAGRSRPAYYWLAATWENLLHSCHDCNRVRVHYDGRKSGKGIHFPLQDEATRASTPGGEAAEDPLFLDPCVDLPHQHLTFDDLGNIFPAVDHAGLPSARGYATISIIGLDRAELTLRRGGVARRIRAQLTRCEKAAARCMRYPQDPLMIDEMLEEFRELDEFLNADEEYMAMADQIIRRWKAKRFPEMR